MKKATALSRGCAAILALSVALAGCSTASKDIAPSSVSPMQYYPYDCQQLYLEAQRIQGRVAELGGRLDEAAANDKALTGVGVVLFWPALFFLGGTKQQEAEYARLRGEYDAIQQASVQKKCMAPTLPAAPALAASAPALAASAAQN